MHYSSHPSEHGTARAPPCEVCAMKREKEMHAVLRRYKAVKAEKAAVEADM